MTLLNYMVLVVGVFSLGIWFFLNKVINKQFDKKLFFSFAKILIISALICSFFWLKYWNLYISSYIGIFTGTTTLNRWGIGQDLIDDAYAKYMLIPDGVKILGYSGVAMLFLSILKNFHRRESLFFMIYICGIAPIVLTKYMNFYWSYRFFNGVPQLFTIFAAACLFLLREILKNVSFKTGQTAIDLKGLSGNNFLIIMGIILALTLYFHFNQLWFVMNRTPYIDDNKYAAIDFVRTKIPESETVLVFDDINGFGIWAVFFYRTQMAVPQNDFINMVNSGNITQNYTKYTYVILTEVPQYTLLPRMTDMFSRYNYKPVFRSGNEVVIMAKTQI